MKKISVIALALAVTMPAAHAGWLSSLFGAKEPEPQTLAEACNTDEIKSICPEILLDGMTVTECLVKNVKSLSTKCATYVKKQATEKVEAVKAQVAGAETDAAAKAQNAIANSETAAKIAQAKADAAEAKATAQEVKANAKATADALKETGAGLVNMFKTQEQ